MQQVDTEGIDTPINRATVATVNTVQLEKELDAIRERRLALRVKLEALAKVKGEKADLTAFLKFDKLLKTTQVDIAKLDTAATKLELSINKLRALVIEMGE